MKEEYKGELFIISSALIWSIFPVISILSLKSVPPILTLALATMFAALFFGITLYAKQKTVVILPSIARKR